jgi:hypothetical protein
MEHTYQSGNTHTLQEDVFAGVINPGDLVSTRELDITGTTAATNTAGDCGATTPVNCDVAVFTAARATYLITNNADGSVTVDSNGGTDGVDTVWNVEQLRFTDQTVTVSSPSAPAIGTATAGNGQATVNFTPGTPTGPAVTSFTITARNAGGTAVGTASVGPSATSGTVTGLANGTAVRLTVRAVTSAGNGPESPLSNAVTPTAPPALPAAPTALTVARNGSGSVLLGWQAPSGVKTGYHVQVRNILGMVIRTDTINNGAATSAPVNGLANGTTYSFRVRAFNATGNGALATSGQLQVGAAPSAPAIGTATRGAVGGAVTAVITWGAAAPNGLPVSSYRVRISRMTSAAAGATEIDFTLTTQASTARRVEPTLTTGQFYRFSVVATNAAGTGLRSGFSNIVQPR